MELVSKAVIDITLEGELEKQTLKVKILGGGDFCHLDGPGIAALAANVARGYFTMGELAPIKTEVAVALHIFLLVHLPVGQLDL